mmetsp:Transcript_11071/g.18085  ORF Transcript_11071/g.18085 Transcript_11071/m.18085 type:complete len:921 (+) Transcript_11071:175-2937(+)|eukprot:CAMPEP_0114427022 /NCGR_PEP_ID=MMETSP0103-20121206/8117_1 /TAXON_ID=37642 ORGANISM="Paraphysomonas imperforata, Strain PA2" /NCGR_SAMPLE_ID=MMETSP0103 /ASSEMBLY_ACC=CAM_ASM_000201 /LENGTH=920 /DNA_ID=CAMNT_0001596037 /DNA_START=175 /DNA_END=2937 /DNA_ORIENTATION=+
MSTTRRSKSEFEFNNLFSGYTHTKTDKEKELDKKLFHGRNSKMAKMSIHGFYEDNSMAARDRKELRNQMQLKRKQSSMNRLHANFESEVLKVKELQRKLAAKQETMAVTALEKYTITFLQSVWRGHVARQFVKKVKAKRFLCLYLTFRIHWRKVSRAASCIVIAYRKYKTLKALSSLVLPSKAARVIQEAYRRRFLRTRGVIRYRAHAVWSHVQLFAICRAKNELCPYYKQRMVVFNLFVRFHRRIRARRIFNAASVNKLFLGLYFCQKPVAKNIVQNSASYLKVSPRSRKAAAAFRPSVQSKINRSLFALRNQKKIDEAIAKSKEVEDKKGIQDTLSFLKHMVTKHGLAKMSSKIVSGKNPLLAGGSRGRSRGGNRRGVNSPNNKGNYGKLSAPKIVRTQSFINRNIILQSVNSYRKTVQDFRVPRRLIHLSSYSQLDPNSIFANQLSSSTNKVIPYEIRGFFRLKTLAEVVHFIQDLSSAAIKCPELLHDPFENEDNASDRRLSNALNPSSSMEDFVNVLKDLPEEETSVAHLIETSVPAWSGVMESEKVDANLVRQTPSNKRTSKGGSKSERGKSSVAKSTPTSSGGSVDKGPSSVSDRKKSNTSNQDNNNKKGTKTHAATSSTVGPKATPSSGSNTNNNSRRNSSTSKPTGVGVTPAPTPKPPSREQPSSRSNRGSREKLLYGMDQSHQSSGKNKNEDSEQRSTGSSAEASKNISTVSTTANTPIAMTPALLPDIGGTRSHKVEVDTKPHSSSVVSDSIMEGSSEGILNFAEQVREDEKKFFESIQDLQKEMLVVAEKEREQSNSKKMKLSNKPQLSVLTTPQLSQSTTTVPDMTLLDSPSRMSQASSLNSDDDEEYDDDFDSMSQSRSNNVSASGCRPSRPSTPVPSSAFYRRQNILMGGSKKKVKSVTEATAGR